MRSADPEDPSCPPVDDEPPVTGYGGYGGYAHGGFVGHVHGRHHHHHHHHGVFRGGFDGMRPVIGSWLIGDCAAGIGIRETAGYVTGNTARFVPHVVRP
jgi:hypothetical protein